MGWCTLKKFSVVVLITYVIVSVLSAYHLLKQTFSSHVDEQTAASTVFSREFALGWKIPENGRFQTSNYGMNSFTGPSNSPVFDNAMQEPNEGTTTYVDIFSKAAIGSYFWEHIFEGVLEKQTDMWSYGEMNLNDILFRFYTGPGIAPQSIPKDVSNLVLIANGREPSKVLFATKWLNYIKDRSTLLKNVFAVLLGNETCENLWIEKYMVTKGGPLRALFITYDSAFIDNQYYFQWPLGVATYRQFPVNPIRNFSKLVDRRKYRCNFIGTVYRNSSRETLINVLHRHMLDIDGSCYIKTRSQWMPEETEESMSEYVSVLLSSDLTLNPVGQNAECYRIYEAMSCGSVPVIEDRPIPLTCGTYTIDPHRTVLTLLKRYGAPVIYVTDWNQLPAILELERKLTPNQVVARRRQVLVWYKKFRRKMRDIFVSVVKETVDRTAR